MKKITVRRIAQRVALKKLTSGKIAHDKSAKLMKRQEKILKSYLENTSDPQMYFDRLPNKIQLALRKVKDQETLWMDVDRWLGDNRPRSNRWASSSNLARFFKNGEYLYNFFSEKNIREQMYEKEDGNGVAHFIPTEVVIEFISKTSGSERKKIEQTFRMIDFKNGKVEHFIEHLANGIANIYGSSL